MKNTILLITIFLFACTQADKDIIKEKKETLIEKEKELSKLKAEIVQLTKEIAELDTTARSNAIAIKADSVVKGVFRNPFQLQGLVESDQNVLITPEVPAKIVKIHVSEGQTVSKGQIIASLDGSVAAAQIQELEKALELAEVNYKKQQRLWEQKIGSEMQYLQARNNYENLQNSIQTARTQLSKYTLRSPISGRVDEVMANEGELTGSITGGPIARIVNLHDVKIKANVSEKYVGQISVGQEVMVYFPSLNLTLKEKVMAVGNVIDPDNRTFNIYIKPSSEISRMKPNLLAIITAYDFVEENVISIPTKLVRNDGERDYVFTLKAQGDKRIVQKSYVEIEREFASATIISSGLEEGDIYITEGYNAVIEGDEVKIID